jgi:hypothetical protein
MAIDSAAFRGLQEDSMRYHSDVRMTMKQAASRHAL